MREGFTQHLRQVLDAAQHAARDLNRDFVTTEHLVLGVVHVADCEAAYLIQRNEVNLVELRDRLVRALPRGDRAPVVVGELPLSPKAQRAIQNALVLAQRLGEPAVSSRLLLASLLEEPDTAVRDSFRSCGADLDLLQGLLADAPPRPEE